MPSHTGLPTQPEVTSAWLYIRKMDDALGQGAIRAAEANWLMAQLKAQRSPTWEAWIAVGDAARRLGEARGSRPEFVLTRARQAYRKAMLTAYEQRSQRGVLAAADAFVGVGDQPLAEGLRGLAQTLPSPRS